MAAFRLTVVDHPSAAAAIRRHIGARRFSYNRCLEAVKLGLDGRSHDPDRTVPWTGFDLINWFNAWKMTDDAGRVFSVDSAGDAEVVATGLGWRKEVCAQVFEEAAQDLGRALAAFTASRRGVRGGPKVGFPRFHKKGRGTESFRLRNKVSATGRHSIRVGDGAARSVTLPVIGVASVLTLTCDLPDLHPALRHPAREPGIPRAFVGLDRGLTAYVIGARADGTEVARIGAPRPRPTTRCASRTWRWPTW